MPIETTEGNSHEGQEPQLSVEQLQAQLAASEEARQSAESHLDRERNRLDSFLSKTPQETKVEVLEPLGAPPDMIENPDGYRAWVVEKDRRAQIEIDRRFEAEREARQGEIATAESRVNLWQTFQANHPEHARLEKLAGFAFQDLSAQNALPNDVAGMASAIAAKMDAMVGSPITSLKPEATRTAGTSGGEVPPTKPAPAAGDDDTQVSMHSAIAEVQKKYGLI